MGITRCEELPEGTVRKWSEKMRLAIVTLYGREGDLSSQPRRVTEIRRLLGVQTMDKFHILQPPATLDQKGWRRVTESFALSGVPTIDAEGAILPGVGHSLVVPVRGSHLVYIENIKNERVGVARVKSESLAAATECCGPENVLQSLLSKLRIQDSADVRVYITGGGPPEMLPHIANIVANWGISKGQVNYDGVHDRELGIGSLDPEKPEQNWVTIRQIQS